MRDRFGRGRRSSSDAFPGRDGFTSGTFGGAFPTTGVAVGDVQNVLLNLVKGVDIAQIVTFISAETKKPVLKEASVQGRITIYSAERIRREDALQLIYDALEMAGIAVIETPREIQLVPADMAKTMRIQVLGAEESASSITNKSQLVQKIFKLKMTSPKSIQAAILPLVGRQGSIGGDERTKTLVLTDTAASIARFEQIIAAFDRVEAGQMTLRIVKLQYATADEVADMVAMMATSGESGMPVQQQSRGEDYYRARRMGSAVSSGGRMAGDVTIYPDARTNWLIIAGPPEKVDRIEKIVAEIDVPGRTDVGISVIDVKHADAFDMATDIQDMLTRKISREKQEVFMVRSNQRGNQLLVLANVQMFKMVQDMVKQLDTTQSVQRATRTYELKYMDANDMADQLNQLYQDELRGGGYGGYGFGFGGGGYGRSSSSSRDQPRFVPSVRTNSIMVIASPTEYEFIERMIKELDVETPEENLAPHVYHIVHTDASEMVAVLTELFQGSTARTAGTADLFTNRPRTSTSSQQGVGALYGKVRFVVYTNTNSIVAITNNPNNFGAIEDLIKQLDVLDPEATNMLVIQIQFANVVDLSNNLNNLLSEGAVSRPATGGGATRTGTTTGQTGTAAQSSTAEAQAEAIYPWQSASAARRTTTGGVGGARTTTGEARPVNNLINQVRIVPDVRSQKLIVAAPSIYFDSVKALVAELDKPEPQVQLETYIVRVDTEGALRIGWRWMPDASSVSAEELDNSIMALGDMGFMDTFAKGGTYLDKTLTNLGGNTGPTGTDPRNWQPINKPSPVGVTGRPIADTFHGGTLGSWSNQLAPGRGVFSADVNLALLVQLLVKNRNASVVAHPQVTVNNNEQGTVFVGEDVPFETGSVTSTEGRSAQTTVEYREVGTRLEITPQINKQGRVVLTIAIENSRRKPELLNGRALTELQTYNTKLTVENGQKVWLGGLSEQRLENIIRKFPILGDIPILGFLFRKTDKTTLESKIYAFVTPTVLDSSDQAMAQFRRAKKEIDNYQKAYEALELKMPGELDEVSSSTRVQIPPLPPLPATRQVGG